MTQKKIFEKKLYSDKDGLRFATPWQVATYRAKKLKCNTIADISCGIGGQTIYFAKECEIVYAIEIDPTKIKLAKKNCKMFGLDNIEFVCGDALDEKVLEQIPKIDVVFSDPARAAFEPQRDISRLHPGILDVMETYRDKTANFAFEAPPQLSPDKIPFTCECEYLSLDGKLNRLNLYFGNIKSCNISAITLPSETKLCYFERYEENDYAEDPLLYLYEIDPAVVKAGLVSHLASKLKNAKLFKIDEKRIMLTASIVLSYSMIKSTYKIIIKHKYNIEEINGLLKDTKYGKVLLRTKVKDTEYWNTRLKLEADLKGTEQITLFVKNKTAYLCEKL